MSEHNEELPLTRRERRLREMGETGAMDLSEVAGAPAEATPEAQPSTSPSSVNAEDIEISPVNEDGTPRSRREMRQLREAALAELAASQPEAAPAGEAEAAPEVAAAPAAESEVVPAAEAAVVAEAIPAPKPAVASEPAVAAEPDVAAAPDVAAEPTDAAEPVAAKPESAPDPEPTIPEPVPAPVAADTAPGAMPDFDTLIAPPTEPFTVDELREASRAAEQASAPAEPIAEVTPVEDPEAPAAPPAVDAPAPAKAKRRFPWGRNKDADEPAAAVPEAAVPEAANEPAEAIEPEHVEVPASTEAAENTDAPASTADPAAPETIVIDEVEAVEVATETAEVDAAEPEAAVIEDLSVDAEVVEATPVDEPITEDATEEPKPAPAAPKAAEGYSFPDIVPPEEWRSVFDDPASRVAPADGSGSRASGDFDDLISRAVAQEGSSGGSNTSALILPSMPDDTGGLSGPLGGTGELYLTGSLELPKSLGETGGHSALHDSIEMDPIAGYDPTEAQVTADHGPAPVSARHAVSARVPSSIPVVAKPTKERSKLPLVLSLTGGGLLVAVVALGVWGASNGMFG